MLGSILVAGFLLGVGGTPGHALGIDVTVYAQYTGEDGDGSPYSDRVDTFKAWDVLFGTKTEWSWHPFELGRFGAEVTGCLWNGGEGLYSFTVASDDGATLFIDDAVVVSNPGIHAPDMATGSCFLETGVHQFKINFFENGIDGSGLDLYLPPGVQYGCFIPGPEPPPPLPGVGPSLFGLAFGDDRFVAGGDTNTLLTSWDATQWVRDDGGTNNWFLGMGFGQHTYVAVGASGTVRVSTNGITWAQGDSGTTSWLYDAAWGNGTFVAVGDNGTVLTSSNATTWMAANSGTFGQLESVVFGKNHFVAVGYLSAIVGSADGSTWTNGVLTDDFWLHGVTYGHDRFVAVGEAGAVLASTDGLQWTIQNSGTDRSLQAVTCGANGFVVVGEPGLLLRSKTGADWEVDGLETNRWLFDVVEAEGLYVAVGAGGTVVRWDAQGPGGPLRLTNSRVLPDGRFEMTVSGALRGQALTVLTSANLVNWEAAATLTGDGGPLRFTNGPVSGLAVCYYRVASP